MEKQFLTTFIVVASDVFRSKRCVYELNNLHLKKLLLYQQDFTVRFLILKHTKCIKRPLTKQEFKHR